MKSLGFLLMAALAPITGHAAGLDAVSPVEVWQAAPDTILEASDVTLEDFLWIARPIVVFADTPADPRLMQQLDLLTARMEALVDREVVVIVDTNPRDPSPVRRELRARGFMVVLIAKDGSVVLRKPDPWDVRELSRAIDKIPLRQQELKAR
jgi:hypothetical protein